MYKRQPFRPLARVVPAQPRVENMHDDAAGGAIAERRADVRVDGRKLSSVLNCYSVPFETIVCCIVHESALVLHVILSPSSAGSMTYYMQHIHSDV